jgi:uncharacterized lipoprotein YmbA
MRRWLLIGAGLLMLGCATGLPGSATRHLYDLCVVEGGEPGYCEVWAPVQADKLTAGRVGVGMIMNLPMGR